MLLMPGSCLGHMDQAVMPSSFVIGWSSGQGELNWSTTKALHCLFLCSVLSSLQVPANPSCLLCPTAVTFPGCLPALGQEVKSQRVSTKQGNPIIFTAPLHQDSSPCALCCAHGMLQLPVQVLPCIFSGTWAAGCNLLDTSSVVQSGCFSFGYY